MRLLARLSIALAATALLNAQSESDIFMLRWMQWFQSIVQKSVPMQGNATAAVTLTVKPDFGATFKIAGAVEGSEIKIALVLPGGQRINENESGKYGIQVERKHNTGGHTVTIFPELFPDRDVVTFLLPPGQSAGGYRIEADASAYSKDSTLMAGYIPVLQEKQRLDDVSISAVLDYTPADGCPNRRIDVIVTAICGDQICSRLDVSAVARRRDPLGKAQEVTALLPELPQHKVNSWQDRAYRSVYFPSLLPGDYEIVATVEVFMNGKKTVRQQHLELKMPAPEAALGKIRGLPPHKHADGRFQSMEVAVDVQVQLPGDYELKLDLLPEIGGHVVTISSRQKLADAKVNEMHLPLSESDVLNLGNVGPYTILHSRLYRLGSVKESTVCVAHSESGGSLPAPF